MTVALEESVECAVALEQPEDPARWKEDDPELHGGWGYPSFMSWTETRQFAERFGLEFVHFDQKVLGHIRKKPTTMLTNMVTLRELQGRRDTTPDPPWPTTLKERMKESARLAEWAPAMQILMIREAKHLHRRYEQRMAARREDRQHNRATQRSSWTLRSDRHLQRLMALSKPRSRLSWQIGSTTSTMVTFRLEGTAINAKRVKEEIVRGVELKHRKAILSTLTYRDPMKQALINDKDATSTSWRHHSRFHLAARPH